MAETVGDYVLRRLREWDVEQVFAYPGDGINGIVAAFGRADDRPRSSRRGTRRCARCRPSGTRSSPASVGVCMATSGPGAIHLLNGLYDAKLDHVPVVAIVGQTERSAMGGSYQQEVDLQALLKDVASEYLVEVNVPEQLPLAIDRAIRTALSRRAPTAIIIPSDLQASRLQPAEARVQAGPVQPAAAARAAMVRRPGRESPAPQRCSTPGSEVAILVGQGARGAADEVAAGRGRPRRGRREGAARQGRAQRRAAVRHRVDRDPRHPSELRADARLRHAADRRVELPVQPVPARVRAGPRACRSTSTAR